MVIHFLRPPAIIAVATMLVIGLGGCGQAPDSSPSAHAGTPVATAALEQAITVEKISGDVVGRVVPITELTGDGTPSDWTFDASEFRQIEILEQTGTDSRMSLVIFMTTRNNPGPEDDAVQVSGKLRLTYERSGGSWMLKSIENLSFKYTVGLAT